MLKWYILSGLHGRAPFDLSQEPLQTVHDLINVRNKIAHPKVEDFGDDLMVRTRSGELLRNVSLDYKLQDQDEIMYGFGEVLKRFNYPKTRTRVIKGIQAIDQLCTNLSVTGLVWVRSRVQQAQEL